MLGMFQLMTSMSAVHKQALQDSKRLSAAVHKAAIWIEVRCNVLHAYSRHAFGRHAFARHVSADDINVICLQVGP